MAKYFTFPAKDETTWLFLAPDNRLIQLVLAEPARLTPGLEYTLKILNEDNEYNDINVMCVMLMKWSFESTINGYKLFNHDDLIGIVYYDPKKDNVLINSASPSVDVKFEQVLRETASGIYHYLKVKSMH